MTDPSDEARITEQFRRIMTDKTTTDEEKVLELEDLLDDATKSLGSTHPKVGEISRQRARLMK